MKLSTATKIRLAAVLYGVVAPLRWCLRQPPARATCQRGGINWMLDLRKGIQLSIYCFGVVDARYRLLDEASFAPLPGDAAAISRLIPARGSINVVALPVERQAVAA